jgi:hypothetical protein
MIEERLIDALRIKSEDVKLSKLDYYIGNVNPESYASYRLKMPKRV